MRTFPGSVFDSLRRRFDILLAQLSIAIAKRTLSRDAVYRVANRIRKVADNGDRERLGFSVNDFWWLDRDVTLARAKQYVRMGGPYSIFAADRYLHDAHAGPEEIGYSSEEFEALLCEAYLGAARLHIRFGWVDWACVQVYVARVYEHLRFTGAQPEDIGTTDAELQALAEAESRHFNAR